jgi:ATP-dependent RNA helicase DDX23/PRP28
MADFANKDSFLESTSSSFNTNGNQDRMLKRIDDRTSKNSHQTVSAQQIVWKDPTTKPLQEMTERDWRIVRENFDIRVRGGPVPHPARSWDEMQLPEHLRKVINQIGYVKPTPIQMQAIPIGFGANDVVGVAETGSGKTCAFVLPLLVRLNQEPWNSKRRKCAENGPLALILGPTRELVNQIHEEVQKLGALGPFPVRSCSVVGGNSAEDQGFRLQEGVDVVVATPGRLIDLLSSHVAVLNQCEYVVLDEADRMIDMGFEPQVNKVLESLVVPLEARTTFLFSATMPPQVISMAQRYMRSNRIIIRIGDEDSAKNKKIDQYAYVFSSHAARDQELQRILSRADPPIIIFCNARSNCDLLVKDLRMKGRRAVALHSGRNQEEREDNLKKFKEGVHDILVATDVAGRGLDVEDVSHVINYDCPSALDRYCHRIGRTGRAGKSGKASTFIMKGTDDPAVIADIAAFMKQSGQEFPKDLAALVGEVTTGESHIQE